MPEPIVEAVARVPAPALRRYIDRYIAYRLEGFPPGIHRGLPSRHLTFILTLADPINVEAMPGATSASGSFRGVVSGLHGGPAIIRHNGTQVGIAIEATPLGARSLFGLPAGELASTIVEAQDLMDRTARSINDRLATETSWEKRFQILDEALVRGLNDRHDPAPEIVFAWRVLNESRGETPVQTIANEVGWSRRHLSERFRVELGVAPKLAARILRFDRARAALGAPGVSLADVAHVGGYFDQAHFTKDFSQFAGCSPTRWIAEEFPSVQDSLQGFEPG